MEGNSSQLTMKWMGLVAAIWIQAFAGNAYTFPHFSPKLKSVLNYSQFQLNNLGVAKDIGENVGLLTGYLSNKLPPWAILLIGGLESVFGYGVLWLVISERISPIPYWLNCLAICIGANSTTFFNTGVLLTVMRNFPQSRGTVVGILKGFVGLSGAIFTQLYITFLMKDPVSLLLLVATSPLVVSLVSMSFVRPVPHASQDPEEKRNFFLVEIISISLAAYMLLATVVQNVTPESQTVAAVVTGIMLLFLVVPVFVPLKFLIRGLVNRERHTSEDHNVHEVGGNVQEPFIREETVRFHIGSAEEEPDDDEETAMKSEDDDKVPWDFRKQPVHEQQHTQQAVMSASESAASLSETEIENDPDVLMAVGEGAVTRKRKPRRGEDFNLRQSLLKADFWLLFFTFFCGVGSGVTAINNFGQIGQAQGYTDVTMFITLLGIWNFLGRLAGGALSEKYVRKGVPRTVWLAGAQVLMIIGHLCLAWAGPGSLHASSIIIGVCFGFHPSVMIPTASELFGLKHFGKIYNFLTMGDPLGSLLFSGMVAGYLYDREAEKDTPPGADEAQCFGAHCFRLTFLIMAGVCAVGAAASVYITVRIKPVYRSLYLSGQPARALH